MLHTILCAVVFLNAASICSNKELFDHGDYCRERNRLIGTDRNDQYKLIDGTHGTKVMMECHYCNETDDHAPKVWYQRDVIFKDPPREVLLDMASNVLLDRVFINTQHRLTIKNISRGDEGVYFCHGVLGQEAKFKFNYLLDLMVTSSRPPVIGNITQWRDYQAKFLHPMNDRLKSSEEPDFVRLRKKDRVQVEVVSEWEPWGPCGSCKGPAGTRARIANCRLKPTLYENGTFGNTSFSAQDLKDKLFLNVVQLSCQSEILSKAFPVLSEYTRDLPIFIRTEACVGACAKATGKAKPDKQVRYKKRYILAEKAHLTLVCPEASLDTHVTWRKDGLLIDAAATYRAFTEDSVEPKIVVDTFSTLYLHEVTPDEAGNYTCYVDGARVQEVIIYVVAKNLLLKHAFVRHMAYIGLIFLLSFVFYSAGVCILCTRRDKFKDYNSLVDLDRDRREDKNTDPFEGQGKCSSRKEFICLRQQWSDMSREAMQVRCYSPESCYRPQECRYCHIVCTRPKVTKQPAYQHQCCCSADQRPGEYCLHVHIKPSRSTCRTRECC